jgi:hypothetical protein
MNLSALLKLKLNESEGYKSEVTEYKSRRNEVDELKKVVSERDDQILRLQSERNVFQREYNRMKLELGIIYLCLNHYFCF